MVNDKSWNINKLRQKWIEFFKTKDHYFLASASLVPNDDPSLLWINSGVATLKPYFEGKKTPPALRLVNCQKAIRTNDIENVGITARHHTFFEMLGNFSIGDYFKKEAVHWAWEFLTSEQWLNLDANKLYITVFQEDIETYNIWLEELKIAQDHIIKGTRATNFWDMGQGPCGPNTEIYYDRGVKYDENNQGVKLLVDDIENDRYIEIWNIVFSQFNNDGFNNYSDLPRKNIDTGAGLERIISILEDVPTNFDSKNFQDIIKECEKLTKYKYQIGNYFVKDLAQEKINCAFKIISDHIRCLTFAINDGVFPSNKNRGYILRRLIRRAEVYGQKLNINEPFLYKLVPIVVKVMADFYPELLEKQQLVITVIKNEETKFWKTLVAGEELLLRIIKQENIISAENAFKLFDTFGYPIELTKELAAEHNIKVDLEGFNQLLENHKFLARSARKDVKALAKQSSLLTNLKINSQFLGYEQTIVNSQISLLFNNDQEVPFLANSEGYLILQQTPFYAEKGGQAADNGVIKAPNGYAQVLDVQSGPNNINIHYVNVAGQISKEDFVTAEVDQEKRFYTMKNHSGTHLLHAALRKNLGSHVMQIGSFNNQDYLRLDFSHFHHLDEIEIIKLEEQVEQWIKGSYDCEVLHLPYEQAIKLGALAFFGEKYDSEVRVVKFGDFSIELCGGTHCHNSHDVEQLLITSVESKGSGSYRVQALTSFKTINEFLTLKINEIKSQANQIFEKYQNYKVKNHDLITTYQEISNLSFTKENWRKGKKLLFLLQNTFKSYQKELQTKTENNLANQFLNLQPIVDDSNQKVLIHEFDNLNINTLKTLSDHYRNLYDNIIVVFLNHLAAQTLVLVAVSEKIITQDINAKNLLKKIVVNYQGKGGGTDVLAQGKVNKIITQLDIKEILF